MGEERAAGREGPIVPAAGLRSVDRNNKATLPRTRPGRSNQSSAEDSAPQHALQWQDAGAGAPGKSVVPEALSASLLRCTARKNRPIRIRGCAATGVFSLRSGMDSDLEAFSHNPADGSFAALPGQTAAKTNYLNQRFLSY